MIDRGQGVRDAMAGAVDVDDDASFDPSAVAGDTPERAARRAAPRAGRASRKKGSSPEAEADAAGAAGGPPQDDADIERAKTCADLDQNDRDNARRWIIWYGDRVVFVSGMGWLVFDGRQWQRDEGDLNVRLMAQDLVDRIKLECEQMVPGPRVNALLKLADEVLKKPEEQRTDSDEEVLRKAASAEMNLAERRASRRKFAVSTGNAGRTAALLQQAASHRSVMPDRLDCDRMKFNLRNGTLAFGRDLDPERPEGSDRLMGTVDLVPHNREDLITKCADADYDPDADWPELRRFLDRVQPDKAMQLFLQVAHGYALLIGGNDEQRLLFHYGTGANGKSAFLEAIGRLAGSYRAVTSPETITGDSQRDGNKANSDLARLHSARLVTIEELPRGVPLKENLIKALTGGTRILARFLQKEFFEFEPVFTAVLSGNDMPTVSGTDYGIWRRLLIVHWAVTIPEEERIAPGELAKRFDAERSGILNWLIEGALLYLAAGLTPFIPRQVTEFTDDYREERDPVGTFAQSCIVASAGSRVTAGDMLKAYNDWCEANGLKAWNQTSLGNRLKTLGYKKERGRLVEYVDVRLHDVPSKFDPRDKGSPPPRDSSDPGY